MGTVKKHPDILWINKWINITNKASDVYLSELVKKNGLNYTQFLILACIARNRGSSQIDLSRITLYDKGTVARSVDRLDHLGYVRKCRDSADRRIIRAYITETGWELVNSFVDYVNDWNRKIMENFEYPEDLTPKQVDEITRAIAFAAVKAANQNASAEEMSDWEARINWQPKDLVPPSDSDDAK